MSADVAVRKLRAAALQGAMAFLSVVGGLLLLAPWIVMGVASQPAGWMRVGAIVAVVWIMLLMLVGSFLTSLRLYRASASVD